MHRLVFSLVCSAFLAGPISAQTPVSPQDTLAYSTASLRLREKPFPTARALAVLPQGTAVPLYSCSQCSCIVAASQLAGYLVDARRTAQSPHAATSHRPAH